MKTDEITTVVDGEQVTFDFVTSDHHFGHVNIAKFCPDSRPFDNSESTADMDDELVARWNSVVKPGDNVLVLGDAAMGLIAETIKNYERVNGNLFLVPGNHDRVSSAYSESHRGRYMPHYVDAGFTILPEVISVSIAGIDSIASHYPYVVRVNGEVEPDHREREFVGVAPEDEGKPLLHGHTHLGVVHNEDVRQFHVGVDAHDLYPVSSQEIVDWARGL